MKHGGGQGSWEIVDGLFVCVFRAHNLSCIFIEMADTFLYHMVHQTTQDLGDLVSLELLLCCASHYDYEVSQPSTLSIESAIHSTNQHVQLANN